MTYAKFSCCSVRWLSVTSMALIVLGYGCGDSGSGGAGGGPTLDGGVITGCVAAIPLAGEPDLLSPPVFPDAIVVPGTLLEGDVGVDGETREVTVELANYWDLEEPDSGKETKQTGGNQTLSFGFPTGSTRRNRYFFRITLCGNDCAERRAVFTLAPDPDSPPEFDPPLRSRYYQRILFEGDDEVRNEATCLDADSVSIQ